VRPPSAYFRGIARLKTIDEAVLEVNDLAGVSCHVGLMRHEQHGQAGLNIQLRKQLHDLDRPL
jgi:hypothetical protein